VKEERGAYLWFGRGTEGKRVNWVLLAWALQSVKAERVGRDKGGSKEGRKCSLSEVQRRGPVPSAART